VNPPRSDCPTALAELQKMHWTSLGNLPSDFSSRWSSQGCLNDITKRLGYRFRLISGILPQTASKGSTLSVQLKMINEGFAALYNSRPLEFVLRNRGNGQETHLSINPGKDVRLYLPASAQTKDLTLNAGLPSSLAAGTYDLFFNLPDPSSSLNRRASYSIHLANTNMWESSTGYNKLGSVKIN
jgi:Domain of unknown function (DUF4832)